MEQELSIKLNHVSCKIGKRFLLKKINWEVMQGSHWVVFGMNGSGKTTLLSIIAGFQNYSDGELEVLGQQYTTENIFEIRKQIGWVSASFFDKLLNEETAMDIVLSGLFGALGKEYRILDKDILKAQYILKELNLGDKIDRTFRSLSKGEQQNVLIARALINNPKILVLDEPGTGLDIFNREYMLQTVRDIADKTNITIIYVTHYVEEILDIFDQCLFMKNGEIYKSGKTSELLTAKELSNLLEYPVKTEKMNGRTYIAMDVSSKMLSVVNEV